MLAAIHAQVSNNANVLYNMNNNNNSNMHIVNAVAAANSHNSNNLYGEVNNIMYPNTAMFKNNGINSGGNNVHVPNNHLPGMLHTPYFGGFLNPPFGSNGSAMSTTAP